MAKMWGGRFRETTSNLLDQFNASIPFDRKLYREDIQGSIAHVAMLGKEGIIPNDEVDRLIEALEIVREEIERGDFQFNIKDEDIHMAIEKRVTEIVGDIGKKIHTARSRNDQVATDFRLYVQNKSKSISKQIVELIETLVHLAEQHTETLIPGMTHLQHAQPTNFGYHLLAYVAMFKRDYERFQSSIERNSISPLGCGALAGTPHQIDRDYTSQMLGFREPSLNCLDSVSDRDFALEILFNISMLFTHISRLSEELILWSSYEFQFIKFSDSYSTGSSIMPQKKNPDVAELLRAKSGRVFGNLISLLVVMKGLPLAYNKDMQEDKEGVFDSVETAEISLEILKESIRTLEVQKENMEKACKVGHLTATDLADYLVKSCDIPFREAHFITGRAVAKAEELGIDISEMKLEDLQEIDSRIEKDVLEYLSLRNSMNSRNSQGGTATAETKRQIEKIKEWLENI
ncbi:MAG TPA: argininosuccinate lyase [Campylobacterales bacterium]|nr:argininosuccinate lyase [Campylobacterales bacterium]